MRNIRTFFVGLVVAGVCHLGLSGVASADGVLVGPNRLSSKDRAALVAAIGQAKANVPTSFAAVASLRGDLAKMDTGKRGRLAPITPMLKSLGADGLFPMLSEMAVDAAPRGSLAD